MKVTYVSSLGVTGPSRHMIDLAHQVAGLGHEVEVMCGAQEVTKEATRLGLDAYTFPLRHKLDFRGGRRMAERFGSADVVHSHDRRAGLFARIASRRTRPVSVHTFHGLPDQIAIQVGRQAPAPRLVGSSTLQELRALQLTVRAERWLSHLGATVVPSRALYDWLVAHGWPRSRMYVIPYGVPLATDPGPIAHEPVRFATAAYLDQRKAIELAVEACARTKEPVRLDIYGDGPLRRSLEARARSLGVDAVFHGFVGDFRAKRSEYDVFVLPTKGDNLPVAILEAMSAAAPVLATRVGGIPEEVIDGVTGILVPPEDPDALAGAMDRLAGSPELRREMGLSGRRRVAEVFDPDRVAQEMCALYERLLVGT